MLIFSKGKIISEKCERLKNIFQITLLNYYFQYKALTKCNLQKILHLQVYLFLSSKKCCKGHYQ